MYEKRFVAFIDILGFTEKVNESRSDASIEEQLNRCMKFIEEIRQIKTEAFGIDTKNDEIQISTFSDSIVISYPEKHPGGLFDILMTISNLSCSLAFEGFFVRGGLAYGDLYHNNRICYGPAFLSAYELEQIAVYPRVILEKGIIEKCVSNPDACFNLQSDEDKYLRGMVGVDFDYQYIDFMNNSSEICEFACDQYEWARKVGMFIKQGIMSKREKVRQKYIWLQGKFNEFIRNGKYVIDGIESEEEYDELKVAYNNLVVKQ